MKLTQLRISQYAKLVFDLRFSAQVHARAGCYILTSLDDDILYIGETKDLNRRFKEHLDDPRMTSMTSKGKAAWFVYFSVEPRILRKVESQLLFQVQANDRDIPPLNRKGP